jgi:hypothetical protein
MTVPAIALEILDQYEVDRRDVEQKDKESLNSASLSVYQFSSYQVILSSPHFAHLNMMEKPATTTERPPMQKKYKNSRSEHPYSGRLPKTDVRTTRSTRLSACHMT